jgi:hypothetical protein
LLKTIRNATILAAKGSWFPKLQKMNAHLRFWLFCAAVIIAIASYTFAGKPTTYCPLAADYGLTKSDPNSPEKPGPLKAVCHHPTPDQSSTFIILCLPPDAYNAHLQHGDTPISFNCKKAGNQGPCTQ